ncbi:hypothetical protein M0R45_037634 [Rubus argutus]|uniref:Uncharacterized protein n=1 Tax=Rubus argutus TaxID=59490 RepID=A0AAW1VZN0_RUBAR
MPRPHFTKAPPVPHKSDHNNKQTNLQSKARAAVQRERKAHLSIAMLYLQSSHQFKNSLHITGLATKPRRSILSPCWLRRFSAQTVKEP